MIDLKDYLIMRAQGDDKAEDEKFTTGKVIVSRNQLLAEARGGLRQHLRQQLIAAIEQFYGEMRPSDPDQIV